MSIFQEGGEKGSKEGFLAKFTLEGSNCLDAGARVYEANAANAAEGTEEGYITSAEHLRTPQGCASALAYVGDDLLPAL